MAIAEEQLERLVRAVLEQLPGLEGGPAASIGAASPAPAQADACAGVFPDLQGAVSAAKAAQARLAALCLERRRILIEAMREAACGCAQELAEMAVRETGMGRVQDKVKKNLLAATKTPGVEDVAPAAYTGDHGLTLVERAPYGVIGSITPSTNPSETVICNGIGMVAAGNSVVFHPHPGAKKTTWRVIEALNSAIVSAGGPRNLLATPQEPTSQTCLALMEHPDIHLLVVTGGPEIVRLAMRSGKKVIAAGPGNPPVVVDETADIANAAQAIVDGASFDNNVLCFAEKEIFAVESIAEALKREMAARGAYELTRPQLDRLMEAVTTEKAGGARAVNKQFVGKNASYILGKIGLDVPDSVRLAFAEVEDTHPLVALEQLMPVIPLVRCRDVRQAVERAVKAEGGCFHTSVMHSRNVEHLSMMARAANTTIFVKNGPSYAGLGMNGEGCTTFTIASPTGEGVTTASTFTRQRRCVLKDQFRIV